MTVFAAHREVTLDSVCSLEPIILRIYTNLFFYVGLMHCTALAHGLASLLQSFSTAVILI